MVRAYKPKPNAKRRARVDPEILEEAVKAIREKKMSIRKAANKFGITKSKLCAHVKNPNKTSRIGHPLAIGENIEKMIAEKLVVCANWGYPMDVLDLKKIITNYLNTAKIKVKCFKNNCPGYDYIRSFLARHRSDLSIRLCNNIKRSRAAVTPEAINDYFDNLEIALAGVPPENVINYDETNLSDDPGKKKIITKRGAKHVDRIINATKASTSIMISASASGQILPYYVVYKSKNLYDTWVRLPRNGPKAMFNRTTSGWFDENCFVDWIKQIAVAYCRKLTGKALFVTNSYGKLLPLILGKKVLIGDNLSSHLSIEAINICHQHDIHFTFLPANTTHLCQPLDVSFFAPMKRHWRKILTNWKMKEGKNALALPKSEFPKLLTHLHTELLNNCAQNIQSGFKKSGIYPIDRHQVLKCLPSCSSTLNASEEVLDKSIVSILETLRYQPTNQKQRKQKLSIQPGQSVPGGNGSASGDESNAETDVEMMIDASSDGNLFAPSAEDEGINEDEDTEAVDVVEVCRSSIRHNPRPMRSVRMKK